MGLRAPHYATKAIEASGLEPHRETNDLNEQGDIAGQMCHVYVCIYEYVYVYHICPRVRSKR